MDLADETKGEITKLINSDISLEPLLRQVAKELNILPIFTESGGWFGLNLFGDIVSASWDMPYDVRVEYEERIRNLVLFQGIKNYPTLSALLPVKKDADEICPDCNGTGIHPLSHLNIGCYCGGLGWIPKK